MNNKSPKLQIYQGIIRYLLESTNYTLKNIADLSSTSIINIRSIYCDDLVPPNFSSEVPLVRLYQMILEINIQEKEFEKYLPLPKSFRLISARAME
jgi:hypothetical protein